jgi:hypothetical protein
VDNNPNCPQLDDHDYKGVPQNDIMRLVSSQFIIVRHRGAYIVRPTRHSITVAVGFFTWIDAFVFLQEDAKVIQPLPRGVAR